MTRIITRETQTERARDQESSAGRVEEEQLSEDMLQQEGGEEWVVMDEEGMDCGAEAGESALNSDSEDRKRARREVSHDEDNEQGKKTAGGSQEKSGEGGTGKEGSKVLFLGDSLMKELVLNDGIQYTMYLEDWDVNMERGGQSERCGKEVGGCCAGWGRGELPEDFHCYRLE